MKYSDRLRALREDRDMSQTDIAKLFNVGQKTVSNWENGRNEPPYDILKKYAEYFEVTTDYILCLHDNNYSCVTIMQSEKPRLTEKETKIKKIILKQNEKIDYKLISEISENLNISYDDVVTILEGEAYWNIQTYIDLAEFLNVTLDELLR